ncbi:transferrin receptor 1b [Corythoichthys intestinalis]|uniref:transferrin receptor 1b n=1 Tax=Corythoichthys intestinalis TaxID=161448 RepID=UPI0025A67DE1|nr:transferrin receptor 1b [Corythoichthys intestinalis]XP_061809992.1 transferrin receptor protein 1-like [Nerophis lumbriciformis]
MDRVKSTVNNMIKSVQYRRFPLQRDDEPNRHVELKMADDDEQADVANANDSPTYRPAHRPGGAGNKRFIFLLVLGFVVVFTVGYFLGNVTLKKSEARLSGCLNQTGETTAQSVQTTAQKTTTTTTVAPTKQQDKEEEKDDGAVVDEAVRGIPTNWNEISRLLDNKFTRQNFERRFNEFDVPARPAGSQGDIRVANLVADEFGALNLEKWTDVHYVQLQKKDSARPNVITYNGEEFKPEGYLAYSATGKVTGKLVFAEYGRREDLDERKNVEMRGSVMLIKVGKISFAEKVANAEARGASAVLLYPDMRDRNYDANSPLYGHVHLGSGDPYTPGFPSFNHTQFPPTNSSGLPGILAQTITYNHAQTLLREIGGPDNVGGVKDITVEVNNVLVNTEIHNVFGVLTGFIDPDEYVVVGAQRDAWGKGFARAAVGTSVLMELAKAFKDLVEKDSVRPRRSIVFASWGAGEYGSVGATEFLEGYLTSINRKLVTYINLDGVIMGRGGFIASASPLLHTLLENTMKEVNSPLGGSSSLYDMVGRSDWEEKVLRPMDVDDTAYPFLAFAGIPSISFHFITPEVEEYTYYGTSMDNKDHLKFSTNQKLEEMTVLAAKMAGRMALRLIHNHLISLDVDRYLEVVPVAISSLYIHVQRLVQEGQLKGVDPRWLSNAHGSFMRATTNLKKAIMNTDMTEDRGARFINEKLMTVERNLLSPYVSPVDTPFRHILMGRGKHTLAALAENTDPRELHTQLAFATWTIKMCANAMISDIWQNDNEV